MTDDVSNKNLDGLSLSDIVEKKLNAYFHALDGSPPVTNLHTHIMREVERPLISLVLRNTAGNKLKAAAFLGMSRS